MAAGPGGSVVTPEDCLHRDVRSREPAEYHRLFRRFLTDFHAEDGGVGRGNRGSAAAEAAAAATSAATMEHSTTTIRRPDVLRALVERTEKEEARKRVLERSALGGWQDLGQDAESGLPGGDMTGKEVLSLVSGTAERGTHSSVEVSARDLVEYDPELAYALVRHPQLLLPVFNEAFAQVLIQVRCHVRFQHKCEQRRRRRRRRESHDGAGARAGADASGAHAHDVTAEEMAQDRQEYQQALREAGIVEDERGLLLLTEQVRQLGKYCHVRVCKLPPVPNMCKATISSLRTADVDVLVQISGTVLRTGPRQMRVESRTFRCQRCRTEFDHIADRQQLHADAAPRRCVNMEYTMRNGRVGHCPGTIFQEIEARRECVDFQQLKLQEQVQRLGVGALPRSIEVIVEHDLVNSCEAGDDVIIVGMVQHKWNREREGERCEIDVQFLANSVRVVNARTPSATANTVHLTGRVFERMWRAARAEHREFHVRNTILKSVCPQIFGLYVVKLSLLLTLIGGVRQDGEDGETPARGQPHLLLIGDPGTGKSQFLRFAANLCPRSVLTTGAGTTGAGLTCSAVRAGEEWSMEAGALVLADGGMCCIDEFSAIREEDRDAMLEAMEQQTLSVAKAGMVVKLNTRTGVFAVTNPKGRYDLNADLSTNTAIKSSLLSRFDLVLVLLDTVAKDWDLRISAFVLAQAVAQGAAGGGGATASSTAMAAAAAAEAASHRRGNTLFEFSSEAAAAEDALEKEDEEGDEAQGATGPDGHTAARTGGTDDDKTQTWAPFGNLWPASVLRDYIVYVQERFQPLLPPCVGELLRLYWMEMRNSGSLDDDHADSDRKTVRMLQSLVRLSQAHARLMFHDRVEVADAVAAIMCMEASQSSSAVLPVEHVVQSAFPADPDEAFVFQKANVLQRLNVREEDITPPAEVHPDDRVDDDDSVSSAHSRCSRGPHRCRPPSSSPPSGRSDQSGGHGGHGTIASGSVSVEPTDKPPALAPSSSASWKPEKQQQHGRASAVPASSPLMNGRGTATAAATATATATATAAAFGNGSGSPLGMSTTPSVLSSSGSLNSRASAATAVAAAFEGSTGPLPDCAPAPQAAPHSTAGQVSARESRIASQILTQAARVPKRRKKTGDKGVSEKPWAMLLETGGGDEEDGDDEWASSPQHGSQKRPRQDAVHPRRTALWSSASGLPVSQTTTASSTRSSSVGSTATATTIALEAPPSQQPQAQPHLPSVTIASDEESDEDEDW